MPLKRTSQKSNPWQLRLGERQALLLVVDFLMAVVALFISLYFWGSADRFPSFGWDFILRRVPAWYLLLPMIWVILLVEIYDVHRAGDWAKTVRGVSLAVLIGVGVYLLLYFYYVDPPRSLLPRRGMAAFVISATVLTLSWQVALYPHLHRLTIHAPGFAGRWRSLRTDVARRLSRIYGRRHFIW